MKLSEAVAHYGTESDLARALGIKPQAVYQWPKKDDPEHIPEGRQFQIELLTKGKLKAEKKSAA